MLNLNAHSIIIKRQLLFSFFLLSCEMGENHCSIYLCCRSINIHRGDTSPKMIKTDPIKLKKRIMQSCRSGNCKIVGGSFPLRCSTIFLQINLTSLTMLASMSSFSTRESLYLNNWLPVRSIPGFSLPSGVQSTWWLLSEHTQGSSANIFMTLCIILIFSFIPLPPLHSFNTTRDITFAFIDVKSFTPGV